MTESLAVASVVDGAAIVAGDFRMDAAGHMRFAVFVRPGVGPRRVGRIVQRLCEIETYRALALLGPLADGVVRADSLPRVQAALCAVASTLAARAVVTAAHGRALQDIAQMKQRIQAGDVGDAPGAESPSRTLRRDMVEAAGYPLRTLSGVLRFQRAMELLDTGVGTLSDVAMAAGYADQAHMTREFRRFGGFTPAAPAPAPLVRLFV